ncbi:MAG: TIGR01777 family protein [Dehalococcoidia bacterium]|nr:MAG: TIGR01777 family protein [Dehalococcoidia bacterium]
MRVAITGATGLIGTALATHLEAAGHTVHRVRRGTSDDRLADWNPAVGWIRPLAFDGFDTVVHLAGAPIGGDSLRNIRWTRARRELLRTSRIDATRLLVDHLRALPNPPATFIAASAIGYYGNRGDTELTEASPPGEGFLATLARDWERESTRAAVPIDVHPAIRTVILRNGHVLSANGGLLARLLPTARLGLGATFGDGTQYLSWIHVDDYTRVVELALTTKVEGVLNATAPNPTTNRDFTRTLAHALHRPATPLTIPAWALRLLLGSGADELLLWGQRVLPARLLATGFAFAHPDLEGALRALVTKR